MIEFFSDNISNVYFLIVILTLAPLLELRASIPFGIIKLGSEKWALVFAIAVVTNILLGPVFYWMLGKFLHVMLKVGFIEKFWTHKIEKLQKKIHPLVEKYGVAGLGLFIGVPLPGSGVYSGAMGAYILGYDQKSFLKSTVIGVVIAAVVVTLVSLFARESLAFFLKS